MKIQMAPLEGITTHIYRRAYNHHFGDIDLYYIPFISLSGEKVFNHKEKAELAAENNANMKVIPQVITNSAADVLSVEKKFKEMGYDEININLGCPSGTVTPKGRGSGMLRDPMKMDMFLAEVFEKTTAKVSVKTRIGYDSPDEWEDLLRIYNKYPISELIIHARVRQDFYKNTPNMGAFEYAVKNSKNPLCYNGDINSVQDYARLKERFPGIDSVMLGRGLLTNPFLVENIRQYDKSGVVGSEPWIISSENVTRLQAFHDEIYHGYKSILSGDRNLLFKMKEFWRHLVCIMPEAEKHDKKIKKMTNAAEYSAYVSSMFGELK